VPDVRSASESDARSPAPFLNDRHLVASEIRVVEGYVADPSEPQPGDFPDVRAAGDMEHRPINAIVVLADILDEQIDTGEIVYQQKIPIVFEHNLAETVAHTSAQLLKASALGLLYVFKHFDELFANARQQGKGRSYTTPSFKQYRQMVRNFRKLKEEAGNSDGS